MVPLLVLDIETVPDAGAPAELVPEDGGFPKPLAHRVVTISFLKALADQSGTYHVDRLATLDASDHDEAAMLAAFWKGVDHTQPRLVTWNGRGFDMPVLRLRSLMHGVEMAWFDLGPSKFDSYTYRYSRWHTDLMDLMADYGAAPRHTLDAVATMCGLPGKIGCGGDQVAQFVAEGRLDEVRRYCECDVLNLYAVYLRWLRTTREIGRDAYAASVAALARHLRERRDSEVHLGAFLDGWPEGTRALAGDAGTA